MKTVLSMSGGIDSTTLCAYYIDKALEVIPLTFRYGSKHNKYENDLATYLVQRRAIQQPIQKACKGVFL